MHTLRIVVAYKGTHYYGWQDLGSNEQKPTVQGCIHQALKKICKYQDCIVSGASRTDAGVHALGQVAKLTVPMDIKPLNLQMGLNALLPDDIRVTQCRACPLWFNPNRGAISKEYHYYFSVGSVANPLLSDIVTHITPAGEPLTCDPININKMKDACQLFIGTHDFYSFATRDASVRSTQRTISQCEIVLSNFSELNGDVYSLRMSGDGFLKHMVRYISGALIKLARGELDLSQISEALQARQEKKLAPKSKAKGLHLISINY
ncbi:MAG: tRNA pseudouridine(38-40) synthase TruA [Gammaproteobacteria bacterium]|nr:tRNA pseudouridine(38-40) synthase TruA [Gammaproteobacteria bacterium]